MFHACVQKFDTTENLKNFCKILRTKGVFSSPEKGEKSIVARFSFIWPIVSNRWLIRFKTFVS
jgi:hypothetical protein